MKENGSGLVAVLTTIQKPTKSMYRLRTALPKSARFFVVGDEKGPSKYDMAATELLTLREQRELPFGLGKSLPTGHYARKNLGYLMAMSVGARTIYETDDDNAPLRGWQPRRAEIKAREARRERWCNVYRYFSEELIWPRGFPLVKVRDSRGPSKDLPLRSVYAPVQQSLANGSPDVDSIWRLILDRPFTFENADSVVLPKGVWCPFNSQATWWWRPAFPLMYLPSHCPFRMTDIWRSLVAQRCLWEMGYEIVFHAPDVYQDRNDHDLMVDFAEEIPGYQNNMQFAEVLSNVALQKGTGTAPRNLLSCYEALVSAGLIPKEELALVEIWIDDLKEYWNGEDVC